MIKITNLSKKFGDRIIIDNLTEDIDKGEMVAVTGVSGSGKSTLLNILGFIEGDYEGKYYFDGDSDIIPNTSKAQKIIRENISYLFQNYALIDNESVRDNLYLALKYVKLQKEEKDELINRTLDSLSILDLLDKKVATLSGGEQQRVSLTRTIIKPSKLILADEPTGSLDSINRDYIMGHLRDIANTDKTVIIVTHDPYVSALCDREIKLSYHK